MGLDGRRSVVGRRSAGVFTRSGARKHAARRTFRCTVRAQIPAGGDTRAPAAFSLIEIMVAVALLAVIVVGLLAMFYQTQRAFRAGLTQVDVLEGGRSAMELTMRELQEISPSFDTPVTNFEARVPTGYNPLTLDLPGGETIQASLQDLWFIRRINDDWVGESYQISNAVAGVGTLYRLLVTTNRSAVGWLADFLRTASPTSNTNFMRVAEGIAHFRVLPFDSRGLLIVSNAPGINADPQRSPTYYSFYSNSLPPYLDVEMAVLEPKSVEQLRARANNPPEATKYLKRQAGRIHFFRQRVALRNAPQYFSITNVP